MKPKLKFSSDKMYPLMKEYLSGDLTRSQFCSNKEIKLHVFQYWMKKYKSELDEGVQGRFSPIELGLPSADRYIRIKMGSGLEIQIPV